MKLDKTIAQTFYNFIHNQNSILYKTIGMLVLFTVVSVMIILQLFFKESGVIMRNPSMGDVVVGNIKAKRDISFLNKKESKIKRDSIIKHSSVIFEIDNNKVNDSIISLTKCLNLVKNSRRYSNFINKLSNKKNNTIINAEITIDQFTVIKKIIKEKDNFISDLTMIHSKLISDGVVSLVGTDTNQLIGKNIVIIRYGKNKTERLSYKYDTIVTQKKCQEILLRSLDDYFVDQTENNVLLINNFLKNFTMPNAYYNKKLTDLELENNLKNDSGVYNVLKRGQVVARDGDLVTEKNIKNIQMALSTYKKNKVTIPQIIFKELVLLFLIVFAYYFISLYKPNFFIDKNNIIFSSIILATYLFIIILPSFFASSDKDYLRYGLFIPIASISFTFAFLYSKVFAVFYSIVLSFFFFVLFGFNHFAFIFLFSSGIISVFVISKVKKRVDLLIAGLKISIMNVVITLFIVFSLIIIDNKTFDIRQYINLFVAAFGNGIISSILSLGIIFTGESLLNSPTIFRLQELSDTSNPILKKLFEKAIGTYNHSIVVSNIAEKAAIEIGANSSLAKVGGLYHDIGKLENPQYFIENQSGGNIHSQIKPSVSVSIIKAHVKNGIEKAKKERLPKKVVDIIAQHHGNSLIEYFYEQAKEETEIDKEEVQKTFYQYSSENPQFPESAIVLLADQIEAATKSLKKPTTSSIEKIINSIVEKNFNTGILDDSGLTLKNITKIKKVFMRVITGMYHTRVEYPSSKELTSKTGKKVGKKNGK